MGRDTTWDNVGSGYTQAVGFKNAEQGLLDNINKHVTPLIDSIFKDKRSLEEKNYATQVQQNTARLQADLASGLVKESDLAGMNLANINGKDLSKTLNDLAVNDERAKQNQRMYDLKILANEERMAQYKNVNDARAQQYKTVNDRANRLDAEKTTAATLKRDEIENRKLVVSSATELNEKYRGDPVGAQKAIADLRLSGDANNAAIAGIFEGMYNKEAQVTQTKEVTGMNRVLEDLSSNDLPVKREARKIAKDMGATPKKAMNLVELDKVEKDIIAAYPNTMPNWLTGLYAGNPNLPASTAIARKSQTMDMPYGEKEALYKERIINRFDEALKYATSASAIQGIEDAKEQFLYDIEKGTIASAVAKKKRDAERKTVTLP